MLDNFGDKFRPVEVAKKAVGVYDADGEWQEGAITTDTVDMIVIPITPAQLKNMPEGKYRVGDIKTYMKGSPVFKDGDVFVVDEIAYEVRDIMPRTFDGNFTIYFAKRKV